VVSNSSALSTTGTAKDIRVRTLIFNRIGFLPTSKMSQATALIQLTINAIQNNDLEELNLYLNKMPIDTLEDHDSISLLDRLLIEATEYQRKDTIPIILEAWNQYYPSQLEGVSFYTLLFTFMPIMAETLAFVTVSLENTAFLDVLDELIPLPSDDNLVLAVQRAHQVFGTQSKETYDVAYQTATDRGNDAIANYLRPFVYASAEYAEVPEWVRNFTEGEVPHEKDVIITEPPKGTPDYNQISIDDAIDLLTAGLEETGITIENIEKSKEFIRSYLAVASQDEKRQLLEPYLEKKYLSELQDDLELFRVLGPANPIYDSVLGQMSLGGCRMFTCSVFDYDEEDDSYDDWFIGNCESCLKRIRNRWHAIRMPRPAGGWVGCYCSFECLRDGISEEESQIGKALPAIRIMVDNLEPQFMANGIQDRIVDSNDQCSIQGVCYDDPANRPGSGLEQGYQYL